MDFGNSQKTNSLICFTIDTKTQIIMMDLVMFKIGKFSNYFDYNVGFFKKFLGCIIMWNHSYLVHTMVKMWINRPVLDSHYFYNVNNFYSKIHISKIMCIFLLSDSGFVRLSLFDWHGFKLVEKPFARPCSVDLGLNSREHRSLVPVRLAWV